MLRFAELLDRVVLRVSESFSWLVLGVVVALFAQWPVRDLLVGTGLVRGRPQVYLNDYGQLMHATVFLVGMAYSLVMDRHVRFDIVRSRFAPRASALIELLGHVLVVLPWAGLLAYFGWDVVSRSVLTGETFPDTGSPGYPLMRLAFALCLALVALASVARVLAAIDAIVTRRAVPVLVPAGQVAPQEALTVEAADEATAEKP